MKSIKTDWLIMQLADATFPAGGFTFSSGLEAACKLGAIEDEAAMARFLRGALSQAGHGGLPLVSWTHGEPEKFDSANALCHAFLSNHVSNRSSMSQGRAFLSVCDRAFPDPAIAKLRRAMRHSVVGPHYAPTFGAVLRWLGVGREQTQRLFLFLIYRDVLSAAVRLGLIGTYQAQRMHYASTGELDRVLRRCAHLQAAELSQTATLLDLYQAGHDRLDARLFQS